MKYKILSNCCIEYLEKNVTQLITEGWQPLGGVSVAQVSYTIDHGDPLRYTECYAQAMVRVEPVSSQVPIQ